MEAIPDGGNSGANRRRPLIRRRVVLLVAVLALLGCPLYWVQNRRVSSIDEGLVLLRRRQSLAEKDKVAGQVLQDVGTERLWAHIGGAIPQDPDLRILCIVAYALGDERFTVIVKEIGGGDQRVPMNRLAAGILRERQWEAERRASTEPTAH